MKTSCLLGALCVCILGKLKKGMESWLAAASLGAVLLIATGPALAITWSYAVVSAEDFGEFPGTVFFQEVGPLPDGANAFVDSGAQAWGQGVAEAEGVGSQTLKARATIDDYSSGSGDTVQALAQGQSTLNIGITAETSGTLFFDLALDATLSFAGPLFAGSSFVRYSVDLLTVATPGAVNGAFGEGVLTGSGLDLFGTMQGETIIGGYALSDDQRVTFDLVAGTDYLLAVDLLAAVNSVDGEGMLGTADSFNSLGLPGEFWDVVGGTGSFCETGNLDNCHTGVIPIPPAVWLFGSGLLGLIGIARRETQPKP